MCGEEFGRPFGYTSVSVGEEAYIEIHPGPAEKGALVARRPLGAVSWFRKVVPRTDGGDRLGRRKEIEFERRSDRSAVVTP